MISLEGKPSVHNLRIWDQTCLKYSKLKKKKFNLVFIYFSYRCNAFTKISKSIQRLDMWNN